MILGGSVLTYTSRHNQSETLRLALCLVCNGLRTGPCLNGCHCQAFDGGADIWTQMKPRSVWNRKQNPNPLTPDLGLMNLLHMWQGGRGHHVPDSHHLPQISSTFHTRPTLNLQHSCQRDWKKISTMLCNTLVAFIRSEWKSVATPDT